MSPIDLVAAARNAGLDNVIDLRDVAGQSSASFTPVGVMFHHTAGPLRGAAPSSGVIADGDPSRGIPPPLAHALVGRDASIRIYTDGRAYHAGLGDGAVLRKVKAREPVTGDATSKGLTNGNQWFLGIEVESNGTGEPYPPDQITAAVALGSAWLTAYDRPPVCTIHHRQWTSRKIDMSLVIDLPLAIIKHRSAQHIKDIAMGFTVPTTVAVAGLPHRFGWTGATLEHITATEWPFWKLIDDQADKPVTVGNWNDFWALNRLLAKLAGYTDDDIQDTVAATYTSIRGAA